MAILKNAKYRKEVQTTMYGDRNPWTLVAEMKISKDFMGRTIEDPQKKFKNGGFYEAAAPLSDV